MRLSANCLAGVRDPVSRPMYDVTGLKAGIVHFGIGAFHRAHMAVYTDSAMNAGERDWSIIGVSLRSANVANQINPQDGLYSLAERSGAGVRYRVIGSVREVLQGHQDLRFIAEQIAEPTTYIVSFTVTEKGYCRKADGSLDLDLAADSFYLPLAWAMQRRREKGLPGLTFLSCDNLADNGRQLAKLIGEFLDSSYPDLRAWFDANCTCPSTMVDRIVPATTPADLDAAAAALGFRDEAHVVTEPFSQWVIEDRFAGPRPRWEEHGAEIVTDVAPYETAKLRLLNGAHSALAYIGLKHGHEFVHQAIADPAIRPLIERLMREEAAPSIAAAPGQNLSAYADALLTRFENPALNHRLAQIAMDGSQKIPQRWLETLKWNREQGQDCPAILAGLDAWFLHMKGANGPVDDPRAAELATVELSADATQNVRAIFGTAAL
jgi:fructuronate reductase